MYTETLYYHVQLQFLSSVLLRLTEFVKKYQLESLQPKLLDLTTLHLNRHHLPGSAVVDLDHEKNTFLHTKLVEMCTIYNVDISDLQDQIQQVDKLQKIHNSLVANTQMVSTELMHVFRDKPESREQLKNRLELIQAAASDMMELL